MFFDGFGWFGKGLEGFGMGGEGWGGVLSQSLPGGWGHDGSSALGSLWWGGFIVAIHSPL